MSSYSLHKNQSYELSNLLLNLDITDTGTKSSNGSDLNTTKMTKKKASSMCLVTSGCGKS